MTRAAISLVNATLQENISGMRVIQSMVREDRNRAEFDDLNAYNRDTNLVASRIAALVLPLVEVVAARGYCACAFLMAAGRSRTARSGWHAGGVHPLYQPFLRPDPRSQPAIYAVAALRRGGRAHLPDPRHSSGDQGPARCAGPLPQIKGDVEFRDVVFGYKPEAPVLQD